MHAVLSQANSYSITPMFWGSFLAVGFSRYQCIALSDRLSLVPPEPRLW